MNRRSLVRRYLPLAAVVAIQLLIIVLIAPSKSPQDQGFDVGTFAPDSSLTTPEGDGGTAAPVDGGTTLDPGSGDQGASGTVDTTGGGGGGAPSGGGSASGGGRPAGGQAAGGSKPSGGGAPSGSAQATGDTGHCVDGRQFDVKVDFYAPPCTPKFTGDNGGATYQGVTADTIKIIDYYSKGNAQVDTILRAQDAYVSKEQSAAFNEVAEKFINSKYELYGRKIDIETYQGNCEVIPPDEKCLRSEMAGLVRDEKPYFFVWNTSLASQVFDELSQRRTPNIGGWHFRDEFSSARAPFHWDVQISYTRMHKHFADWYCKQMKGPTRYAGVPLPPGQSHNGKPRVLGAIGTNDPENVESFKTLKAELGKCGVNVAHEYHYAQDISTAETQRTAAVAKMRESPESTSILCVCDLVAPVFLYEKEEGENYYPENLISGSGFMDADAAAQAYMGNLGCKTGRNCVFENAFGLSSITVQEPQNEDAGARVWRAGGGAGNPPFASVGQKWDYFNAVATMLQAAGPNLNPTSMAQGVFKYGFRGGGNTGRIKRGFGPGNFAWNQDMRVVYWSTKTPSKFNGKNGSYVQIQGDRYDIGQYKPMEFVIPDKPR